jgi:hypothetical protein
MGRREFIGLLGGATAAWPLAARAAANGVYNQISALSKLRFLNTRNCGLNEMGFVDGQTLQSNIACPMDDTNNFLQWRPRR